MEAVLRLLLLLNSLTFTPAAVEVLVDPPTSQFFKYSSFSVSCGGGGEQEAEGWTVMKRMKDGEAAPCGASCVVATAFPATDSGQYWCEGGAGETSRAVNVSVTAGPVLLDAPVHPVLQGQDVTLACRCSGVARSCAGARVYRDGTAEGTGGGVLTLRNVSRSQEGFYACRLNGSGSPWSWLAVGGGAGNAALLPPTAPPPPVLLRHLLVGAPLLLSTVLLGLLCRDTAGCCGTARPKLTDVVMETAV